MRLLNLLVLCCLAGVILSAEETPLPLGATDLLPDARFEHLRPRSQVMDLEAAFEIEAFEQLDIEYAVEAPSELELLKREHAQLQIRVAELERRLLMIEKKLAE